MIPIRASVAVGAAAVLTGLVTTVLLLDMSWLVVPVGLGAWLLVGLLPALLLARTVRIRESQPTPPETAEEEVRGDER